MKKTLLYLSLYCFLSACALINRDQTDSQVQAFLTQFEQNLAKDEAAIWAQFETTQSKEAVMLAIAALQNQQPELLQCVAGYSQAIIQKEEKGLRVELPVEIRPTDTNVPAQTSSIVFWLKKKSGNLYIFQMEAEAFYQAHTSLLNDLRSGDAQVLLRRKYQPYLDKAAALQTNYDSVVWYSVTPQGLFFYAVNGQWNNFFMNWEDPKPAIGSKMGLLAEDGRVVVPVAFDLVGTVGMGLPNAVEVQKDGKAGYYSLDGKEMIPAVYDWIVPASFGQAAAIVKQDTVFGWLDAQWKYHAGFPSPEAEQWVRGFRFLPENVRFDAKSHIVCQPTAPDRLGYGFIVSPLHWVRLGIVESVIKDLVVEQEFWNASTEYVEQSTGDVFDLTENIKAVVTHFKNRYLDGREEFYFTNKIAFVNAQQDTLSTATIWGSSNFAFRRLSDQLFEVVVQPDNMMGVEMYTTEMMPRYQYFELQANMQMKPLEAQRYFTQTAFVKLDSSYLKGPFKAYAYQNDEWKETEVPFLSQETLRFMRNDILAAYGYVFEKQEEKEYFEYTGWYKPEVNSLEAVMEKASEIDRHNLLFLNSLIVEESTAKEGV